MFRCVLKSDVLFHPKLKDVPSNFQKCFLIYKFVCKCDVNNIGHTTQRLDIMIHQQIPSHICNNTPIHSIVLGNLSPSAGLWHQLDNTSCACAYNRVKPEGGISHSCELGYSPNSNQNSANKNYFTCLSCFVTHLKQGKSIQPVLILLVFGKITLLFALLLATTPVWNSSSTSSTVKYSLMRRKRNKRPVLHLFNDILIQGSIPGRVFPKTQKWYLIPPCLTFKHYKVPIKGKVEQSRGKSSTLLFTLM